MPPPPPPAPPPLPKQPASGSQNKSKNSEPPPDRNALLSQIRKGAKLKQVETNDRSTPLIEGRPSSNAAAKSNADTAKPNGPFPIIPPGGLFAQGIPKLRPTTPRSDNNSTNSNPPLAMVIQSIKQGNIGSASALRVNQLSGSRSQPPSPVSKLRTAVTPSRSVSSENGENSGGNPNFPDDITVKGPAPAPPPQSQKPVFKSAETDSSIRHPTVKRSASQTNLQRPRLARPPPSEKPPPPPKSNPTPPQNAPPPPPSKPPNILRRQSFGVGESHSSRFASNKLSVANNATLKPNYSPKAIGPPPPPPPPRNNSAPNDLNQMVTSSSPSNQCVKMNIAPPPPPNRAVATSMRAAPVRPPPPRAPAPPPPPPPPQHQAPVHPAPPSQMKAVPASNLAPPPPARISSIKQSTSDFEERFKGMFCSAQIFPKPDKFTNFQKSYPSKMQRQKQNTRRQPPPPPPQAENLNDRSRNHQISSVQYDSGISSGVSSENYY